MITRPHIGKSFFVCNEGSYWAVSDGKTIISRLYRNPDKAQQWIDDNAWQTKNPTLVENKIEELFLDNYKKWATLDEFKSCLKQIGGKLVVGKRAAEALNNGKPGHSVCWIKNLVGSAWVDCPFPVAIVLPEDVAFKVVALGGM